MKLKKVCGDHLLFDNGYILDTWYDQECCEENYADFSNVKEEVGDYDFDENQLCLERVDEYGFRFGDYRKMFFVPCYSEQNGYYSSDINVKFGNLQIKTECEVIYR